MGVWWRVNDGLWFRVFGLGCRVFRVEGSGIWVQGLVFEG